MVYKIIVAPAASIDITESIEWYNKARPGLGFKFYKQVTATFAIIQKNPLAFANRYKNTRTALLKKFPYMVHYFVESENNLVVITAVLHTSRDPKMWEQR